MKTVKTIIEKRKSRAFGKDIYLIGQDNDGVNYWLEAPKWDCGWYWGFGYVETYTNNNNPSKARDINSHSHISSFVGCEINGNYIHNLYDTPELTNTTFDKNEGWQLSELFKQFYLLSEMAEFCHKKPVAGCNVTTCPSVDHGDMTPLYDQINKVMVPKIYTEILRILAPAN